MDDPNSEFKDMVYAIIHSHCCGGCDGYNCPNGGEGDGTQDAYNDMIKLFNAGLEEAGVHWQV